MADKAGGEEEERRMMREQDRLLPIANVGRLMKGILPPNAKISKDAKETIQESVSEFVAFVTVEASDKCRRDLRKTLNGDDVCSALSSLGFDTYALALRPYLLRYRHRDTTGSAAEDRLLQQPAPATGFAGGSDDVSVSGQTLSLTQVIHSGSSSNPCVPETVLINSHLINHIGNNYKGNG